MSVGKMKSERNPVRIEPSHSEFWAIDGPLPTIMRS